MHSPRYLQEIILNLSIDFIGLPVEEIDAGLSGALQKLAQFLDMSCAALFRFSSDGSVLTLTHEWHAEPFEARCKPLVPMESGKFPGVKRLLAIRKVLYLSGPDEIVVGNPAAAVVIPTSMLLIPLFLQGEMIGFIDFESGQLEDSDLRENLPLFRMLGTIFANTLKRSQTQAMLAGQHQFLELLATGTGFSEILHELIRIIEAQWPGMLGLVLLLDSDGEHLHLGASISLPQDYLDSIEGLKIGPNVGSCGTASYLGERVIVEDIADDPRWEGLRDLALKYGLIACWSEPIFSSHGDVVGTFAMYYRHRRAPTPAELRTIEIGAHLAGVAIERKRADEALQESQRKLATLISTLPGMAYRCKIDAARTMEFVSMGSMDLTGYPPEALIGNRQVSYIELIHPEDQASVRAFVEAAIQTNQPFQITYRIQTPAGEKWVWEQGQEVKNAEGKGIALEGFITDITARVETQQHLEQRVTERTHELSTLLEISHNLASTLELEPLLDLILDQLGAVVNYDAASIMILNRDVLQILAYRGPIEHDQALQIRFPVDRARANYEVIRRREPVIIEDVRGPGSLAKAIRDAAGDKLDTIYSYMRCWMGVPLIVKEKVVGMLTLDHRQPCYYADEQAELTMAFASHAAVAIENARLYQQAEQAAVTQERNRLARDLHDAVTQTLFSASLIAEVLPRIWERNADIGREKLEELRQLTRGALSEMRTLLLELRPDTLADVELKDLYRHLVNAFIGRTRIPVSFTQAGEAVLPPAVKQAFYRVAQEALNNIAKHASASNVEIRLMSDETHTEVRIEDDGCGFDALELLPENLGLKIMRERAEAVDARLEIQSAPGAGVQICMNWQAGK